MINPTIARTVHSAIVPDMPCKHPQEGAAEHDSQSVQLGFFADILGPCFPANLSDLSISQARCPRAAVATTVAAVCAPSCGSQRYSGFNHKGWRKLEIADSQELAPRHEKELKDRCPTDPIYAPTKAMHSSDLGGLVASPSRPISRLGLLATGQPKFFVDRRPKRGMLRVF